MFGDDFDDIDEEVLYCMIADEYEEEQRKKNKKANSGDEGSCGGCLGSLLFPIIVALFVLSWLR
ncbi:MAG: hypothetical protein HUJ70_13275 [Pseudobutyrivibrio sp.]|nr:hypothetical protein [Pseudobutyrivibrio sp.]